MDRIIEVVRQEETGRDPDYNTPITTEVLIARSWAEKQDVSDSERIRAAQVGATITTRFRVYYSSTLEGLDPTYQIRFGNRLYDVSGVKEIGRREGLEITATARADAKEPA